jgi:nitroreductase
MVRGPQGGDFNSLLEAAGRAPSGDNTQPWWFVCDSSGGRISLGVDETKDPSPMNSGQRMARIAVGAALENLLYEARRRGWDAELEPVTAPDLAAVRLWWRGGEGEGDEAIPARVTNRRVYDRRPVPPKVLDRLRDRTPTFEGVSTHWIVARDRIGSLAGLIGRADALVFGDRSMRLAFLSKVRFDAPPDEPVSEGLPLGSLELSGADRIALRLMARMPDWMLRAAGAGRVFASKARHLVESASGLCLVVASDASEATDLSVGRAMGRAWLALTAMGLAAQPMMSPLILENLREYGDPAIVAAVGHDRLASLSRRFRELMPEIGGGRPAFLLRFGYAPAPSGRTGRRPPQLAVRQAEARPDPVTPGRAG